MSHPVPAVTEAEATGETPAIYADIRQVYRVSVVNLVWRHLATFPGALPWAWGTVRPLYIDGTIRREAASIRAVSRVPEIVALPHEVFAATGLETGDFLRIPHVLDAYDRTNPMALIALSVVQQRLGHATTASDGDQTKAILYQSAYSLTVLAQVRCVRDTRRSGVFISLFQASQQAFTMAS